MQGVVAEKYLFTQTNSNSIFSSYLSRTVRENSHKQKEMQYGILYSDAEDSRQLQYTMH